MVASRHPLWEARLDEQEGRTETGRGLALDDGREVVVTSALDGEPEAILKMPGDSPLPFLLAVTLTTSLTGLLTHLWWLAGFAGIASVGLIIAWVWPRPELAQVAALDRAELPHG
ncbi:hypothetical protein [Methyloceanibacter marginalis]|uniref:hypothetical protein n=1 Tax=Methyloceanibacter marginalis TaxID=1774971 RepID=UPI00313A2C85